MERSYIRWARSFWKLINLGVGIGCETQMPPLWDGGVDRQRLKTW